MTDTATRVVLPHTGMTVPNARLGVRKMKTLETSDGEAYTAELLVDGKPAGLIENRGDGGATTWCPTDLKRWGVGDMAAYVAACLDDDGEPLNEEFVLGELFEEAMAARRVAREQRAGKTSLRTFGALTGLENDRSAMFVDQYMSLPGAWSAPERRLALAAGLWRRLADASRIQVWDGERWQDLPRPGAKS